MSRSQSARDGGGWAESSPLTPTFQSAEPVNTFPDVTKGILQKWLRILRWETILYYLGDSNVITRVPESERGRQTSQSQRCEDALQMAFRMARGP